MPLGKASHHGKTHPAIGLGIEAAKRRRRVAFVKAADLVRTPKGRICGGAGPNRQIRYAKRQFVPAGATTEGNCMTPNYGVDLERRECGERDLG